MRSLVVLLVLSVPAFADDKLGGAERAAADTSDAAYDRGFVTSTAKTLAAGEADVSLRGGVTFWDHGVIASVAAGLGKHVEVSFGSLEGPIRGVGLGLKVSIYTQPTWSIAAVANVTRGESGSSHETLALATVRLTTCLFSACQMQVTAGIGGGVDVVPARRDYADLVGSRGSPAQFDGSVMLGTGILRPLLEGTIMEGTLIIVGVRLATSHVSIDLGVGRAMPPSDHDAYYEPTRAATVGVIGIAVRP
jgi:hypothetical protein